MLWQTWHQLQRKRHRRPSDKIERLDLLWADDGPISWLIGTVTQSKAESKYEPFFSIKTLLYPFISSFSTCDKDKRFISLKWGLWKWSWPNFNDASAPPFSLLLSSLTHSLSLSRSPLSSSCLTSSLADWITTVMHVPNYLHPTPPHSSTTQASNPLHTSSLHTRCTLVQCVQIAGICVHALRSWMRVLVTEQIKQRNVFSPAGLIRFHPCLF